MRSLSFLLVLVCSAAANAVALDYVRPPLLHLNSSEKANTAIAPILPNVAANCSTTITYATLRANETFLTLQGIANDTNVDCLASSNTTLPPNSIFHVYTKSVASLRDANNKLHRGKICDIVVPTFALPINATEKIDLAIPLTDMTTINCSYPTSSSTTAAPTRTQRPHTTTAAATTTTTRKATPTHNDDDDDGSSSADWVSGQVTFFNPNQGACGDWNDDDDMIVALGPKWYGNMNAVSKYCNKKILVTGPKGNSITVTVKDACPPCAAGHLDLSPAAFAKLGDFDTGILKVKWQFL